MLQTKNGEIFQSARRQEGDCKSREERTSARSLLGRDGTSISTVGRKSRANADCHFEASFDIGEAHNTDTAETLLRDWA